MHERTVEVLSVGLSRPFRRLAPLAYGHSSVLLHSALRATRIGLAKLSSKAVVRFNQGRERRREIKRLSSTVSSPSTQASSCLHTVID